jgi:hypothetical protein
MASAALADTDLPAIEPTASAPAWLKRRGGELPSRVRADVFREYREVEAAFLAGRATEDHLKRALERVQSAEL